MIASLAYVSMDRVSWTIARTLIALEILPSVPLHVLDAELKRNFAANQVRMANLQYANTAKKIIMIFPL